MTDYLEVFGDPVVDAFMQVGVTLAVLMVLMGWAQRRWGERWADWLVRFPRTGPALAALLSLPPGCVGVLTVVALYDRRRVSFGTVVAGMLATMGDAAWILLAMDIRLAVQLKVGFFILGLVGGYIVDVAGIAPRARQSEFTDVAVAGRNGPEGSATAARTSVLQTRPGGQLPRLDLGKTFEPVRSAVPTETCCGEPSKDEGDAKVRRASPLTVLFWALIAFGFLLQVPVEFNLASEEDFAAILDTNIYMLVGIAGFAISVAVALRSRFGTNCCQTALSHGSFGPSNALSGATRTIVLVGTVALAFVAITEKFGVEIAELPFNGFSGVLLAAAVGLIPSCGLEVILATLFLVGGMPFPALIAYLVSHSGAGLLPLLAVHRRSAVVAAALTMAAAVIVGLALSAIS